MRKTGDIPQSGHRIARGFYCLIVWLERLLALVILGGVVVFTLTSLQAVTALDWQSADAFDDLIYRALLLVIGLELVRTLVIHDLMAVLELLVFVIARKLLKPDLPALGISLSVLAFVALLAARRWFMPGASPSNANRSPGPPTCRTGGARHRDA